jgi:hypothetical protein
LRNKLLRAFKIMTTNTAGRKSVGNKLLDVIVEMRKEIFEKLDGLEKRLDGVEKRLDGVEKRLDVGFKRVFSKNIYHSHGDSFFFFKMIFIILLELTDVFGKEITNEPEKKVLKSYCRFFQDIGSDNLEVSKNFNIGEENILNLFGLGKDEIFFVRPAYLKLANIIYNNRNKEKIVMLTGSPGIGKTLFIIYWVWFLLKKAENEDISV